MTDQTNTQPVAPEPEAGLVAWCEGINASWLTRSGCYIQPYLFEGEIDSEWRVRLMRKATVTDAEDDVLCSSIMPSKTNGHMLYLTACAVMDAEARGREIGRIETLQRLFRQQCITAGLDVKTMERMVNLSDARE